ncbi:MAG: FecR domain-containing protein [Prolixibacteraceae bacterium]
MKRKDENSDLNKDQMDKLNEMNTNLKIPYTKSKDEVWAELTTKINTEPRAREKSLFLNPGFRMAIAASLVILLGLAIVMRYITTTVETLPGEHQLVNLPDGSTIEMNAGSVINYHPYWWKFERTLTFNGEAFFDVKKGIPFTVKSSRGLTKVLGTSFTIYSRKDIYRVTCLSGKVKVMDIKTLNDVILDPNQKAELNPKNGFNVKKNIDTNSAKSWIDNKFIFTSTPISEVIEEIERQFDVSINGYEKFNNQYTGNFDRNQNIEQVLDLVCRPFGIEYQKTNANEFELRKNK